MSGTITRGKMVRGDGARWDGVNISYSRQDATGGTVTGLAVDNEVDVAQVFGAGSAFTSSSISKAVAYIGSRFATIVLAPTTWTIDASVTIPSNICVRIPAGAVLDIDSGITLTINGIAYTDLATEDFTTGSGTLSIQGGGIIGGISASTRTAAEILAGVTVVNGEYSQDHLYRYGTNTTPGTTDMGPALASAALVAAYSGRIIIPTETISTTTATALPSSVVVSGGGYLSHIVTPTVNLTAIFTAADKTNIRIEGVRFEGDNTSSASSNGIAAYFTDCDDVVIDRCWFTLFRGSALRFQGDDVGGHDNFTVSNCFFYGNKYPTGENGEIAVAGGIRGINVTGCRFEADATDPYPRGIFCANNGPTLNWSDLTVDNCYFNGYSHNAIGTTDEDPSATFDNGIVKITNCTIIETVQCGIKVKNSQRCIITGNYLQDCDSTPETAGSLQGSIFVNASQDTICANNIIIGAGTDGIRVIGLLTAGGGTAAGAGRAAMNISGNLIEGAGESGIFTTNDVYESIISGNSIRNSTDGGIRIQPGSGTPGLSMLVVDNNVRGTTGNAAGILVNYVTGLTLSGNQVKLAGGYGVELENCADVVVDANRVMDNGVGGTNTSGIRINITARAIVSNNRAGNSVATDQDYGLDIGSTVTGLVISNNDFTGNQITPTLGVTQDAMIQSNLGLQNNNATAANIAAVGHIVNTSGKYAGKTVFDTTNGRLMIAIGSAAADPWYIADGSASVTPS